MKSGQDIAKEFPGLFIVHHNKPGQKVDSHTHTEHHLIIPLRGELSVQANGEPFSVSPGRMLFVPSLIKHEFLRSNQKEGERLICMISKKVFKPKEGSKPQVLPTQKLFVEILFYLLLNSKSGSSKKLIETLMSVLEESLAASQVYLESDSLAHLSGKAHDERVQRVVRILEERFSEPLSIAKLSKEVGLSERNLSRLVKAELGLGPKELLIKIRLSEACRLLREEQLSVTETCFRVGYQSLSRFIQSFRQYHGFLPSEVGIAL